jgi:hypothetical protein
MRERRRRSSRRTVIVSIVIHAVALGALVFYSFWSVDELWSPSVKVKLFAPGQTPPGTSAHDPERAHAGRALQRADRVEQ